MNRPPLRVIGTSVTLTDEVRRRAAVELPFPIRFEVMDGETCFRRGVLHPESYDIYDQWFYSVDVLWTAGAIQPIDTAEIARWHQIRVAGKIPGATTSPAAGRA